eukprot:m.395026 g.395026  ORF g.395026 m.395026 type:complete len:85 (-) comp56382_c1_seq4:5-259(-)
MEAQVEHWRVIFNVANLLLVSKVCRHPLQQNTLTESSSLMCSLLMVCALVFHGLRVCVCACVSVSGARVFVSVSGRARERQRGG